MARAKQSRIFFKYLMTYITILLLPISIMSFVVYHYFVDQLQDEVITGNVNLLDKVRYVMDDQLKRVEDTTYQMMVKENHLAQYRASGDPGYKAWGIVKELRRYYMGNPFVDEMWLYYRGEASVFTNNSVYSLPMLTRQIYRFDNWSEEEIFEDLNTLAEPKVRPPTLNLVDRRRVVPILIPIHPRDNQPYATLVYLIQESSIRKILSNQVHTGGSTWVLDRDNRIVTGVGDSFHDRVEEISALFEGHGDDAYRKIVLDSEEYYLFMVKSEQTGWKFTTLLPVRHVLDKVWKAQKMFQYGLLLIFLTGGLFVYFGMRWNYRPIRQLKMETERIVPLGARAMNELETVRFAINSLALQNRQLDEKMKSHAAAAKKHWLLSLLKGDFDTAEALAEEGEEGGFLSANFAFRVAIVELPSEKEERRWTAHALEELLPEGFKGFGIEHFDSNRYIFLIAIDSMSTEADHKGMERFRAAVRNVVAKPVTLGVGTRCDLAGIPTSYLEANTAIDYRFIHGNDRTIYFEDITPNQDAVDTYFHDELEQVRAAVRSGNAPGVESSMNAMVTAIRSKQPPLIAVRALCYEIIRTVNRAWVELGIIEEGSAAYPDVFSLERLETLDAFEQLIRSACSDLSQTLAASAAATAATAMDSRRSIDAILEHIEKHGLSLDFSFQNMAREFGIALPNMSAYFKEQTGLTLLEYTTNLRMETAKRLLLESDATLKSIAEEVGYYNVSSFIRRFKQVTGSTPKEYRMQHGKGNGTAEG
ncbi:helix-turn-helix domain-containing protein [Paenibacillus sp.]|uniref:helix-turn-helix domain-containing protein n=1 Tax=Paenibacillus sp. TaxID=58172 RepID=UPI002D277CCF|nr:helix-turn-helix domain-containing protein [Paenibacillus sp.]HZG85787.1 helix-turn-helix domain-containing protein [Paenibacillus sp.]